MTFYLGQLSNGQLIGRSSTRSDFTHAAIYPPALAYRIPSFGTSPAGARRNAETMTNQANLMEIEVVPVRVVEGKEYREARKFAKANGGLAPDAIPVEA